LIIDDKCVWSGCIVFTRYCFLFAQKSFFFVTHTLFFSFVIEVAYCIYMQKENVFESLNNMLFTFLPIGSE
ncbi:hypothetical protein, partial [Bacteroides fragilis]